MAGEPIHPALPWLDDRGRHIQAHGGAIWIAATDTGTAVHITLPVPQDAPDLTSPIHE